MAKQEKAQALEVVKDDTMIVAGKPLGFAAEGEDIFAGQQVTTMISLADYPNGIRGIFEGAGVPFEAEDPGKPGEKQMVGTWVLRVSKSVRVSFATSAQLDAKLGSYPIGEVVAIKKLSESRRSRAGRVVSQYLVSDPPQKA